MSCALIALDLFFRSVKQSPFCQTVWQQKSQRLGWLQEKLTRLPANPSPTNGRPIDIRPKLFARDLAFTLALEVDGQRLAADAVAVGHVPQVRRRRIAAIRQGLA